MKISTVNNSSILTHYYAFILEYEDIFPPSKRFRLIVKDRETNVFICNTMFVSQELAREYFYRHYGKRSLNNDASISDGKSPNDVEWSAITLFQNDYSKVIRAIIVCLEWLAEDSNRGNTYSPKGVN